MTEIPLKPIKNKNKKKLIYPRNLKKLPKYPET